MHVADLQACSSYVWQLPYIFPTIFAIYVILAALKSVMVSDKHLTRKS